MRWSMILLMALLLSSCNDSAPAHHAVYVLVDRSGSYAQDYDKVISSIKVTLARLEQGDSFALARIDNENFSERDIAVALSFSSRPSQANAQKRAILQQVEKLANEIRAGSYTDVTGGLLHAMTWLNATGASTKIIIVFSDFPDEPRDGYMREFPVNFTGARLVVWNVPPAESVVGGVLTETQTFTARANAWQERVMAGGGNWQLINDVSELNSIFH